MPHEPAETEKNISKIRVRKPTGEFLERRFYINNTLEVKEQYNQFFNFHTYHQKNFANYGSRRQIFYIHFKLTNIEPKASNLLIRNDEM